MKSKVCTRFVPLLLNSIYDDEIHLCYYMYFYFICSY